MKKFTLDSNCIYALENAEPSARYVQWLAEANNAGLIKVRIPAIAASEAQKGGGSLGVEQFSQRLTAVGLDEVKLLRPMAYSNITLTNFSLAHEEEMLKLEKQIHRILCPQIEFHYTVYNAARSGGQSHSPIAKRWLNAKCDIQSMWCHIHYDGDIFVTGDNDFHKKTKKGQLIALGAGMICRPNEAVALLPSTVMDRQ